MKGHFVHMFSVLFFPSLLVICCTSSYVSAYYTSSDSDQTTNAKRVTLFTAGSQIDQIFDTQGTKINSGGSITPTDFYSPFLVATNNKMIVALTGVNSISGPETDINILTKYSNTEKVIQEFSKPSVKSSVNGDWTTQFAIKEAQQNSKKLKFFLAGASNDKVYILLVNEGVQEATDESDAAPKCEYSIITSAANTVTKDAAPIKWGANTDQGSGGVAELKKQLAGQTPNDIPSNGFVLLTEEGNIFFVLQFAKQPTENKINFAFIQFKEAGPTVTLADPFVDDDCTVKLFTWKEKIMLAKYCNGNKNTMHELQLSDGKWIPTAEPISRLLPYLQDGNNFTAAKIDNNVSVLLFTQQKKASPQCTKNNCIDLLMTDGSRLHNVGLIVTDVEKEVISAGLLYTKEKHLFSLHEQTKTQGSTPKSIILTHLQEQQEKINAKLEQWKTNHKNINELYKDTATRENLISTDGLVGFLSGTNKKNDKKWTNVYHNFDATINERGGKKLENENGFKFSGEGAGAQWPVIKTENNEQLYNFKDFGFTLLATVTVGGDTNDISVLGVGLTADNPKKSVGLWCTANGKWAVKVGTDEKTTHPSDINCTRNEKYYVALVLDQNKKVFIYVDGEQIPKSESEGITITQLRNIDYFYFGADKETQNAKTDVTITDVLLYNRPFEEDKVEKLKPKKEKKLEPEQKREGDTGNLPTPDESTIQTDNLSPGTSATQTTEKDGAETKLCLFSMNIITVLSLLFGVFTLLGRCVY